MSGLVLAPLRPDHVHAVAAIERASFSEPWSEMGILRTAAAEGSRFIVALQGDHVVGYAGMLTVLDEGYIANIATHPDHRRQGVGRSLVACLAEVAQAMGLGFITLEVRVSNAPAIALYKAMGFVAEGIRPGYYDLPHEDAVIMTLRFAEPPV